VSDRKPFDAAQYEADDAAKHLVIRWLARRGWAAAVNDDLYGVDVIAERGGSRVLVEVEVKHAWSGDRFPFDTLHYSARKMRFIAGDDPIYFVTVNDERTQMLIVSGERLLRSQVITKDTIYTEGEQFLSVPLGFARLRSLTE
jgi:hypothetical protein